MASPFIRTDAEGCILTKAGKTFHQQAETFAGSGLIGRSYDPVATHSNGTAAGSLSGTEPYDLIAVNLTAGQTYSFAYRGTAVGGIEDPLLALFNSSFGYITEDDDGGLGRSSMITFTPTTSGTYYLYATSWYTLEFGDPSIDTGNYTIDIWTANPAHDAPATLAGAVEIDVGTTFGHLDAAGDRDMYRIDISEGMVYTFTYNGGIYSAADWDDEPGENIGIIELYDASGALLASGVNYETGVSYFAEDDGFIYVRVRGYETQMTGGYTLDVAELNPADYNPLESLNWDSANNVQFVNVNGTPTAYVYFAAAGQNFGEVQGDSDAPLVSLGWTEFEIQQVMLALEEYEKILGVNYEITTDLSQATFRLITTPDEPYGARFYPQDPAYGTQQGIGTFNVDSGGWGAFPQSLERGGYSFAVILHEFGHAHGIAHPHDNGGGSEVMLGVSGSTGSYGVYDLNQGVYTVMSYNDAWDFHPDGPSAFTIAGIDNGWSGSLSAFDIAVLQQRYGVHAYATGDDVYQLADNVEDAFYQTIWDSAGTDEIRYDGARDAQIDLTAATLDYTPTGGGVISFIYNEPGVPNSQRIRGGYTIANGVVIENASGGSGHDVILGNDAANLLRGNAGDDFLMGRGGADTLDGGAGFDTVSYAESATGVRVAMGNNGSGSASDGDRYISIEAVEGSNHADTLIGGNSADTLFGLGGDDVISGGNNADTLDGGDGDDRLDGGNDNDTLIGGNGDDTLDGGNGNDVLNGGAGNDTISGGNGNDVINGGAGDDRLQGGNGNDRFLFDADSGTDTILDFRKGDIIDLSALTGVDRNDVTISAGKIFVENGDNDLTIFVQGDKVTAAALVFGSAALTASFVSGSGAEAMSMYQELTVIA